MNEEQFPLIKCECGRCEFPEETFICPSCGQNVWWCHGGDDAYPDLCAWCWNQNYQSEWKCEEDAA